MNTARILIVEDDAILAAHLSDTIEKLEYHVAGLAGIGEQAVAMAIETLPDAILMDIRLRGKMNGIVAAEKIHEKVDIPIVYLTAYTDEILLQQAKVTDAYAFLTKPVRDRELRASLEMTLYKHATEQQLAKERYLMKSLLDTVPDHIYFKDASSRFIRINKEMAKIFGLNDPAEAVGKTDFNFFTEEHARAAFEAEQEIIWNGKAVIDQEEKETWPDGHETWVSSTKLPLVDSQGHTIGTLGVSRDITERKKAEKQILSLNRTYAVLSNINQLIVRERDRQKLLEESCRIAVEDGKFLMCWIGFLDEQAGCVKPVASAGKAGEYLDGLSISLADAYEHKGPIGIAIRENQYSICSDIEHDDRMLPWQKKLIALGCRSSAAFPLRLFKKNIGIINFYSGELNHFGKQEINLLNELAGDISYALESLKKEEQLEYQADLLQRVSDAIIATDNDNMIRMWNPAAEKIYGWKEEEAIGKTFREIVQPEYKYQSREEVYETIRTEGVWSGEIVHHRKDGEPLWFTSNIALVRDKHGNQDGMVSVNHNITERKRADEALAKERNLLRTLIDALPDRIYAKDTERRFILNNTAHLHAIGVKSQEEAIGKTDYDFRSREDSDMFLASDIQVLESGKPIVGAEFPSISVSGGPGWMLTTKVPLKDAHGNIIGLVGNGHDITERKKMLDSLRKLSHAVEQNPSAVMITNLQGEIEYVNPKFTSMTGYSREEIVGKNPRVLKSGHTTHDDYEDLWRTILAGKEWHGEFQNRKKDGSVFWVSAHISPIVNEDYDIINFLGLQEDITDRKQTKEALEESEIRYRRLVDHSPDAIVVHSDGVFSFVNPAAVQLFGAQDESQLIGKPILNFIHPDAKGLAQERIHAVLKNEKALPTIEEKYLRIDGTPVDVEVSSLPIVLGKKNAVQVIIRDITEKKKMQGHLLQSQKVESIGTLAGGIAHDFNNILGIIVAYTSILQRIEDDKAKVENCITAINKAVSRGAGLVKQILTFARQNEISIKPMSVPELAHEVVAMLQETFPKVIEFKETFERGIPLINADHTQIHQAVLNLCVNARDAMPQGGVITMNVITLPRETIVQQFPAASFDRYVCLSVSDTGSGIDEPTKKRIFDPFFTTKELGKGTGLGLSVVYGVMQSHYGFVSVDSEVGKGTTFRLFLPIPQEINKIQADPRKNAISTHTGTETILFVEDEELLRTAVASKLQTQGYTVHVAVDGLDALDVYKQHKEEIALVITDMGLPKKSGVDVFHPIKKDQSGTQNNSCQRLYFYGSKIRIAQGRCE